MPVLRFQPSGVRGACAAMVAACSLIHAASISAAMPAFQRSTLSNGLVLLHAEEHSLPIVNLELLVDAGSSSDPVGQEGVAHLTARALLLGGSRYTLSELNEELDRMGAVLSTSCGKDFATVSLKVLSKDLGKGLDLFMDALTHPRFPRKELRREVSRIRAALQAAEQRPGEVAERVFAETLFAGGPYGHAVEGTDGSLRNLSRAKVRRFYRSHYVPARCALAVVGDISADELKRAVVPLLEQWSARGGSVPGEPPAPSGDRAEAGEKTVRIDRDLSQTHIVLGHLGLRRDNPDFYAVSVMNYILGGGGFASRLLTEIRNEKGLAYSVSSSFFAGKHQGLFQIVLQTKNASAREAVGIALRQMERIRGECVTDAELEGAKRYLTGSFPLRIDTSAKLANFLVQMEFYGLGLDYPQRYPALIDAVSKEDVLRVARAYLHPDACTLVVVGNLEEAGMQ